MQRGTKATASGVHGAERELAENATVRLPRGRSTVIVRVELGTVLVTQEGDLEDHVLEPGDEIALAAGRLAVAWAFTAAAISVREAAPSAWSRPAAVSA